VARSQIERFPSFRERRLLLALECYHPRKMKYAIFGLSSIALAAMLYAGVLWLGFCGDWTVAPWCLWGQWCVVYTFVGLIVLVTVPAFRVTLLNIIAFVIGALIGSTIFSMASGQFHSPLDNYPDAIHFVGAVTGGVVLVWLKMRFVKSPSDSRLL